MIEHKGKSLWNQADLGNTDASLTIKPLEKVPILSIFYFSHLQNGINKHAHKLIMADKYESTCEHLIQ